MSAERMAGHARVLVIEDEASVRRFLRAGLSVQGYQVIEAVTGGEGLALASQYVPDVILLDLGLPDRDGLDVVRGLREWSKAPIVVVSARGQERQKVEALDAGADDYLTKPFGLPELLARLRVALRRARSATGDDPLAGVVRAGSLEVDVDTRRVRVSGEAVHLTPIEYRIVIVLVRHAGKVVTQTQLLHEVWGPAGRNRGDSLRVFMAHLRRKFREHPDGGRLLQTEAGVGYRLQSDDDGP